MSKETFYRTLLRVTEVSKENDQCLVVIPARTYNDTIIISKKWLEDELQKEIGVDTRFFGQVNLWEEDKNKVQVKDIESARAEEFEDYKYEDDEQEFPEWYARERLADENVKTISDCIKRRDGEDLYRTAFSDGAKWQEERARAKEIYENKKSQQRNKRKIE